MAISGGQQTSFPLDQTSALFSGSLPDAKNQSDDVLSYVSEESSDEMPFGRMLQQGTGDRDALLMSAQDDTMIGILVRSQAYAVPGELGDTGLKPKTTLNVLTKGRIGVKVTEQVKPGDPVRVNANGGTFQTSADAGNTLIVSHNARWLTSAAADEIAELQFDMVGMSKEATADV